MKLKNLLKNINDLQVYGSKEVEITGFCANSKLVAPGNCFIAKKGRIFDGVHFIDDAVAAGASAVLTPIYNPSLKGVVQIIHPDPASIEATCIAEFYQYPTDHLFMVGITGTNGKTTTGFLLKNLLDYFKGPCGLIGTIEYIIGNRRYPAIRTTPDIATNYKMLREMVSQGCHSAVMEVTSHALDQGRVDKLDYDVGIFSNLTLDHLDYHETMENYCLAKNKLFRSLGTHRKKRNKCAVINVDSPWHSKMIEGLKVPKITYGIDNPADLRASDICFDGRKTHLNIDYRGKRIPSWWPLVGRFNVYNCLSAIGAILMLGIELELILERMKQLPSVRGRMEPVPNERNMKIYVDFAHSDDSLKNVLETLKEFAKGRIITVFGCGGDRDQTKRPKMAAVAEKYSDKTIVTSDNPRSEDPQEICNSIVQGFQNQDSYIVELDRWKAIQKAITMATDKDVILIAGKGHETSQILAHKTIEFDDVKVAAEICSQLKGKY